MNDESFVFGGLTETDALFLAKLTDENGINTSGSGVGHEIAATLDNDEKPLVLNQYYSSKLNDYKNGSVKYPYKDLSPGPHSIKLKVWDTYNTSKFRDLYDIYKSPEMYLLDKDKKIISKHIGVEDLDPLIKMWEKQQSQKAIQIKPEEPE